MDTTKLIQLQVSQIDREKKELTDKQRIISKRVDHLERALRKAELPLLAEDYERQKADDKAAHEAAAAATIATAEQTHRESVETKKRLARMMDDYNAHRRAIAGQREEELQKKKAEMKVKIDAEKAKRRAKVLKEREDERLAEEARKQEEEGNDAACIPVDLVVNRILVYSTSCRGGEAGRRLVLVASRPTYTDILSIEQRAKEEAKHAEEEAAKAQAAAKREAQLEARRKEQEAALAKLKIEEEAERRRAERRAGGAAPVSASPRPTEEKDAWRRRTPGAAITTPPLGSGSPGPAPPSTGGKWVPPARRAAETPMRTGSPAPRTAGPSATTPASPSPATPTPAAAAGGWRAREAAKKGADGSPVAPSTPEQAPATPATDNDGFQPVQSQGKWRPSRGRGSGFGTGGRS